MSKQNKYDTMNADDLFAAAAKDPDNPEINHAIAENVIPDKHFNGLLDSIVASNRETVKEKKLKGFTPIAVIIGRERKKGEKDMQWTSIFAEVEEGELDEDHHELFVNLGEMIARKRPGFMPVAIHFSSEAWVAAYDKGKTLEDILSGDYVMPSQSPNREEQLTVMGMTIDGRLNMSGDLITRRKDGTIKKLEPKAYAPYVFPSKESAESHMLAGFFVGWKNKFDVGGTFGAEFKTGRVPDTTRLREMAERLGDEIGGEAGEQIKKTMLKRLDEAETERDN